MAKSLSDLQAWALLGAQQRLRELDAERAKIHAAFPDLSGGTTSQRPKVQSNDTGKDGAPTARKRRRMSADARRRISEAQKARWAKQKAGSTSKKRAGKAATA